MTLQQKILYIFKPKLDYLTVEAFALQEDAH